MNDLFDRRQVRHAFGRAASSYADVTALQREVEGWLLESLMYLDDAVPETVLDVGSGLGGAARAMRARWPKARIVALDAALPMLHAQGRQRGWRLPGFGPRGIDRVCADAAALPLPDHSIDVLFSNLCLQWTDDLAAVFAGFRRVLRPGGLLLVSTFGHDTLHELRTAFAYADNTPHVSPFVGIAAFGDLLMQAGFRNPVLDREVLQQPYPDLAALMHALRAMGATNALQQRRRSLTGRARFARAAEAYETLRPAPDAPLPSSWDIITAMAWAPDHGAPIRDAGGELAHFPANAIPVRRRAPVGD